MIHASRILLSYALLTEKLSGIMYILCYENKLLYMFTEASCGMKELPVLLYILYYFDIIIKKIVSDNIINLY